MGLSKGSVALSKRPVALSKGVSRSACFWQVLIIPHVSHEHWGIV